MTGIPENVENFGRNAIVEVATVYHSGPVAI
jgi:hypothetical protein